MSLLYSENPLVVNPELAEKIGLNEAIVLQQLHYWIQKSTIEYDGYVWVYNTIDQWREQFRFFSADTIKRTLKKLKEVGLVRVERLSKDKRDRTNYYAIDYKKLESFEDARCIGAKCTDGKGQNAPMSEGRLHRCINDKSFDRDYTETTTETTRDITPNPFDETRSKKDERARNDVNYKLPEWLDKEAWNEWVAFRKEQRKKLTPMSIKKQIAFLQKHKADHVAIIEQSIRNGWTGLFELKHERKTAKAEYDYSEYEKFGYKPKNRHDTVIDTEVNDG